MQNIFVLYSDSSSCAGGRLQRWAMCFRTGSHHVTTNNYIERFWRTIKHEISRGRLIRRVDDLIQYLVGAVNHHYMSRIRQSFAVRQVPWKLVKECYDREVKAKEIYEAGLVEVVSMAQGTSRVRSQGSQLVYNVNLREATCDCKDTCRYLCKHLRAAAR